MIVHFEWSQTNLWYFWMIKFYHKIYILSINLIVCLAADLILLVNVKSIFDLFEQAEIERDLKTATKKLIGAWNFCARFEKKKKQTQRKWKSESTCRIQFRRQMFFFLFNYIVVFMDFGYGEKHPVKYAT